MQLPLSTYVGLNDEIGYRVALRRLLSNGVALPEDVAMLRRIANSDSAQGEFSSVEPDGFAMQLFLGEEFRAQRLRREARISLIALRYYDTGLLDWLTSPFLTNRLPGGRPLCGYPIDIMLLLSLDNRQLRPAIQTIFNRRGSWSMNILCRCRLEGENSKWIGSVLSSFADSLLNSLPTGLDKYQIRECQMWKYALDCVKLDGFRKYYAVNGDNFEFPKAYWYSPFVEWMLSNGHEDWLASELKLLGSGEEFKYLRNRLVVHGNLEAVQVCCEQIRKAKPEDYNHPHHDVIHNALRLHPKPLPKTALDACLEVIRHPSHPAKFQHRIEALELLVDGANLGTYKRGRVAALVVQLAQNETDPDVRVAAINLIPWANPQQPERILASAIGHESIRIREAAERVLGKSRMP